jgi:hypothetical protein
MLPEPFDDENLMHLPSAHSASDSQVSPRALLPAVVEPLEVLPPPELDVELEVELVLDELPDGFEQGSAFGRSPTRNPSSSSSSPSLQPLDDPPLEEPPLVDPPAPSLVPPEELPVSSLGQFAFVDEPPLGVLLSEHANRANGTSQQTARKFMTGLLVEAPMWSKVRRGQLALSPARKRSI